MKPLSLQVWLLAFVAISGTCFTVNAQEPLVVGDGFDQAPVGPGHLFIFRDSAKSRTIGEVMSPEWSDRFKLAGRINPSYGYSTEAFWVRFTVRSEASRPLHLVVDLANARFDDLEWHVVADGQVLHVEKTGNQRPHEAVGLRSPTPALNLNLMPGDTRTIYLRAQTETSVFFPLALYSDSAYLQMAMKRGGWNYIHMGMAAAIIVIGLFLSLVLRTRLFAFHAGIAGGYLCHNVIYNGYYTWLQWPFSAYITRQGLLVMAMSGMLCLLAYVKDFFENKLPQSRVRPILKTLLWLMAASLLATAVLPYRVGVWILNASWLAVNGVGAATAIWQYAVRKRLYWRFNLLAWMISVGLVVVVLLELAGFIPILWTPQDLIRNLLTVVTILQLVAIIDRLNLLAVRDRDIQKAERNLAESRFEMLRYQINPHFLFNTLNSIDALAREQPERISELVRRLSTFLRTTLNVRPDAITPFRAEIESVQAYLGIESVRFEDRLQVEFDVHREGLEVPVPELILQPLVENAVKHGMDDGAEPLRIRITARLDQGRLAVTVANTGRWNDSRRHGDGGLGLKNLRERLAHVYGRNHEFTIGETAGWVVASLSLPAGGEAPA